MISEEEIEAHIRKLEEKPVLGIAKLQGDDAAILRQLQTERDQARFMCAGIRQEAGWKDTWPFPWEHPPTPDEVK